MTAPHPRLRGLVIDYAGVLVGAPDADEMVEVVRRARASGLRTALLSNSWRLDSRRHDWHHLVDECVLSGEVGMSKPDRDIYLHTARLLDLEPHDCVFVDDAATNVRGAVAAGMVGVQHHDAARTVAELEALFGVPLGG